MRQRDLGSADSGSAGQETAGDPPLPTTAAALVAALWRNDCAAMRVANVDPSAAVGDLRAALVQMSTDAELLAIRVPDAERPAARLLVETARAAYVAIDASSPSRGGASDAGGWLPSAVRRRLARMERWLSARAATDPTAEPAANLCLWILDQLEADTM